MSSSDYTNLRRIRHVYYPTLNNCHTQPVATPHTYVPNNCYVHPATHSHCDISMVAHEIPIGYPHGHAQYPQQGSYGQPMSIVNYPPMMQPVAPSYNNNNHSCNNNNNSCNNNNNSCNNCSQKCCNYNQNNSTTCSNEVYTHPVPVCYIDPPANQCLPDKTTMSTSKRAYLLSPTSYGSTTFTIDCQLGFKKGMKVNCTSDLSSNNYFEGEIYDYNGPSGEITMYKLTKINGSFTTPAKYTVTIVPAFQEIDKLRERMEAVYLELFGIDISGPDAPTTGGGGGTTVDVTTENTQIKNLYTYFFGTDITSESGYAATTTYLTTKINELYAYFFDKDLTSSANSSFNPNGNNVSLASLSVKVQQLNLYFFGNANLTTLNA